MAIRKYGTEPAKTEVLKEDNDRETLSALGSDDERRTSRAAEESERDSSQRD